MQDNLRAVRLRVGRNVEHLRRVRGWSQEKLAEMSGRTNKIIGQVERGETNVTIDILTSIAAGLSVNVADLFRPSASDKSGEAIYMVLQQDLERLEETLRAVVRVKRANRRRDRS